MSFKDDLEADLTSVFFDTDEFGEEHSINGTQMLIVPDDDLLKERQSKLNQPEGIYTSTLCFHVQASVFGDKPVPEMDLIYDGDPYTITDVQEDAGEYIITLGMVGS
jgi:hypothetical protein